MTPTKEQVLKSAATSPEAKKALAELFPDYFEPEYCQVDEETTHACKTFSIIKNAAKQIAPVVSTSFMNVMNWGDEYEKEANRRSFYLGMIDRHTRWEIKEVSIHSDTIQILCPVEYKQK